MFTDHRSRSLLLALLLCVAGWLPGAELLVDVVSPGPSITGTQAAFAAQATGGSGTLAYSWRATGPRSVAFAPAAAATTVATFSLAGNYSITATVTDQAKGKVSKTVAITVVRTATTLAISPSNVVLNPGANRTFSATVLDQFNRTFAQPLTWTAVGGAVNTSGRYVAGAIPGSGSVTATVTAASAVTATAGIRINAAPTVATPAGAVASPAKVLLSVLGADDGGEAALRYLWTSNVGGVTFSGATQNTNAAKSITAVVPRPGTYTFTARIRDAQGLQTTSAVVVVIPANWPPVAPPVAVTTNEDTPVAVRPTATDPDTAVLAWSVAAAPAHGVFSGFDTVTGAVTYTPNANWNGTDQATLSVTDGTTAVPVPVTIVVVPVNDPPVLAGMENAAAWFRDGDAALAVTGSVTASDVDNTTLAGATVRIAGNYRSAEDVLAFASQNGITGTWDAASGSLALTGQSTLANYQAALRSVTYLNTSAFPSTAARTITLTVNDGQADSNPVSRNIDLVTRSAPAWSEGFEGYAAGSDLQQFELQGVARWHGWDANPAASASVASISTHSGGGAVAIAGTTDLVHEYKGCGGGAWRYAAWQFIPAGFTGQTYFILLNTYRDNGAKNWSTQVSFNGATGKVHSDFDGAEATLVTGRWVELQVDIDLVNDQQRFYYDGALLCQKSWSGGVSGGGAKDLAAVDIYANNVGPIYYDDLSLTRLPSVIQVPASYAVAAGSDLLLSGITATDANGAVDVVSLTADSGSVSIPAAGGGGTVTGDATSLTAALATAVYHAPAQAGTASIAVSCNGSVQVIPVTVTAPPGTITIAPLAVTAWDATTGYDRILLPAPQRQYHITVVQPGRYHFWLKGDTPAPAIATVFVDGVRAAALGVPMGSSWWNCRGDLGLVQTLDLAVGDHVLAIAGVETAGLDRLMLVAETPAAQAHGLPVMVGIGGVAVINAREYDRIEENTGYAWLPTAGGSIQALPELQARDDGAAATDRGVSYDVNFTQAGTYQIRIRGQGDPNAAAVLVGVDDQLPLTQVTGFYGTALSWGGNPAPNAASTITIAAPGIHRVNLRWYEDGTTVDQIAISGIPAWGLYSTAAQPAAARIPEYVPAADGTIVFEAEGMAQSLVEWSGAAWVVGATAPGAVGQSISALPDVGRCYATTDYITRAPGAIWYVRFDVAGSYDIWARGAAPDLGGDSWYLGMMGDGNSLSSPMSAAQVGSGLPLAWTNARVDGSAATITIPAPGIYPVNLWMCEDGAVIDRILIQPSGGPAPTGDGPPVVIPTGNG